MANLSTSGGTFSANVVHASVEPAARATSLRSVGLQNRASDPDAEDDSYEFRAYAILKELAGGQLPRLQVPAAMRNLPVHEVLFLQLRMYMHEQGIEDNELIRLLNAQSTMFDRTTSRFTVSAGIQYSS